MSEQGRKQEDISSSHKSPRTATTALTPQLGPPTVSPSLLAYPLPPPPPHHDYSHRLYTMMRPGTLAMAPQMAQSIQTAKPCLTNDMGPPIFMPSLNLGTPKGSSSSSASSPNTCSAGPISSLSTSSSSSSVGVTANAHPISDMILSNAPAIPEFHHSIHPSFYSTPGIRPASGHMSIPTGAPQVSAVVASKRPTVSSGNIAKPTPVQATHGSKIGGGTYIKTIPPSSKGVGANPLSISGSNNKPSTIPSASSSGVIPVSIPSSVWMAGSPSFPPGSSVIKQPLSTQQHHHHHAHGPTVVSVHSGVPSSQAYSPLVGRQPSPHQQRANPEPMFIAHPTMQGHVIPVAAYPAMLSAAHGAGGAAVVPHPTSSTLTELLAPSPVVATSSLRDGGGGGKVGKVHEVAMRPYSPQHISTGSRHGPSDIRERSTSGDTGSSGMPSPQTRSETHTTSAQPTPNADHIDTRLERPAQPSSGPSGQLSSPLGVPSHYQGPPRERSNSTDMPSVIPIISNPGLTGRHIAAISSNQPPGYAPSNSGTTPQSLQPAHTQGANPYRSVPRSKSEYGVDSGSLPPDHPTTLHLVAGSTPQVQNASPWSSGKHPMPSFGTLVAAAAAQSALAVTAISSSSSSSSSSVNSPGGAPHHPNSLPLSASGSPNLSPSRRPGIIRKRPHESWTGSPNLNKIPFGSAVSLSSPSHTPRGGDNGAHFSHPLSPPISTHSPHHAMAESLTNHDSSLDSAPPPPGDIIPSPRKKRRKQDVIATDDQYASNVPNNIRPDVAMAMESDLASPRQQVSMATRTRGRRDDSSSPREDSTGPSSVVATPLEGGGEKAEVHYLSQLRQPQWPINGLYRTHHRAAHNHFRRHADIKHIEIETVTATGIANDKTAATRASGWKIYCLDPQLEEMLQVERDVLDVVKKVKRSLSNLSQCATCPVPSDALDSLGEIIEGNVARSNRIISHLETTRNKMVKLLDHKPTVLDLLSKYSTNKRSSPFHSLPHKLRT